MTPLEINQRIAELKGYALCKMMSNPPKWDGYVMEGNNPSNSFLAPNWAEDISAAWVLFEEMPEPFIRKLTQEDLDAMPPESSALLKDCKYIVNSQRLVSEKGIWPSAFAPTATQAICKAWLQWKEGLK